ncbi:MAG: Bax protein [Lentisphaeria bacterium]|jgi:Bax protein
MKSLLAVVIIVYLAGILVLTLVASHCSTNASTAVHMKLPPLKINHSSKTPNFRAITDIDNKKQTFFNFFAKIIDQENEKTSKQRKILVAIHTKDRSGKALNTNERDIIDTLSSVYGVDVEASKEAQLEELLLRVRRIPKALALAQAANESAWGTSRFAVKGNNYFGQWCYTKGCGLVPTGRSEDAGHEVRAFRTPAESVAAYIRNLNTHPAYQTLREIRQKAAANGHPVVGSLLAEGLLNYSEKGITYVEELKSMIKYNELE